MRAADTVARLGGDEFAVLLPDVADVAEAEALGRRVLDSLDEPVRPRRPGPARRRQHRRRRPPEHGDDADADPARRHRDVPRQGAHGGWAPYSSTATATPRTARCSASCAARIDAEASSSSTTSP